MRKPVGIAWPGTLGQTGRSGNEHPLPAGDMEAEAGLNGIGGSFA